MSRRQKVKIFFWLFQTCLRVLSLEVIFKPKTMFIFFSSALFYTNAYTFTLPLPITYNFLVFHTHLYVPWQSLLHRLSISRFSSTLISLSFFSRQSGNYFSGIFPDMSARCPSHILLLWSYPTQYTQTHTHTHHRL